MKLNKRVIKTDRRMYALGIPKKDRKRYIGRAFPCRIKSWPNYKTLDEELEKLEKDNEELEKLGQEPVNPEDTVKKINSAFDSLNRYSEENYPHHPLDHPPHHLGHFDEF